MNVTHTDSALTPRQEGLLLLTLAVAQFTHILDFIIMMPLGPQLMRVFSITPQQFGWVVSSYTFSAAVAGLVSAFCLDRFDRKRALLSIYSGFILGTFLCAIAPSYPLLMLARMVAGAFGGIMNATVYSIIGDLIPEVRRGKATGTVMSAFSVASIVGVPLGLALANHWDWHAPFLFLSGLSLLVWFGSMRGLPSVRGHLTHRMSQHPLRQMFNVLREPNHWWALSLTVSLVLAGFSVIPYLSPYLVANAGLSESDLPYIYFCGGMFTIFTSRRIGQWADRYGKQRVFGCVALLSILPILTVTNLPRLPMPLVIVVTTFFMILVSGRFVPAMAIVTGSVRSHQRGSFMSVNSCMQQLAAGLASSLAGAIIGRAQDGTLTHYSLVGLFAVMMTLLTLLVSRRVQLRG